MAIQTRLSSLDCGSRFKYYKDGPTWVLHSKEARDGYWHLWVQQIYDIEGYEDLELLDSADQFVFPLVKTYDIVKWEFPHMKTVNAVLGELENR